MTDTVVPAPTNEAVSVLNIVLDALIKGAGPAVAILYATTAAPWLGLPIVSQLFKIFVDMLAGELDKVIKVNIDNLVIQYQNDIKLDTYKTAMINLARSGSADDLQKAKDAIDSMVNRNK